MSSLAEFKRNALDVGEFIGGALLGGFNNEMTVGQVALDAVISAFPVAGEVTAARDVVAQLIRMCRNSALWSVVMEWVMLILPLLAIVPGLGGVLKGVGKLLLMTGKSIAKDREIVAAMIKLCNRLGVGDAPKFLRELKFASYKGQVLDGLNVVVKQLDNTLTYLAEKANFLSSKAAETLQSLHEPLAKLQSKARQMIGKACDELDTRMAGLKKYIPGYKEETHAVTAGKKSNVTRRSETRLTDESGPAAKTPHPNGHPQNGINDYQHVEGWPDLRKRVVMKDDEKFYETIAAFSGKMEAKSIRGPKTLYRVLHPAKNGKPSPWWTETLPKDAREWREGLAVLDTFNKNGYFIKYEIPAGVELKVWCGKAAEQIDTAAKQYLPGGAVQLFIEWPANMRTEIEKLPELATGWGKTLRRFGYDMETGAKTAARTEDLGKTERASKKLVTG